MSRTWKRAAVALFILLIAAATVPTYAAQRKDEKKGQETGLSAAQRQELTPLVLLVDDVMKGTTAAGTYGVPPVAAPAGKEAPAAQPLAAPADVPMSWKNDFLKAQNGLIYVPYTVSIEPAKLGSPSVVAYLRVATKGTTAPPVSEKPADKDKAEKDKDKKDARKETRKDDLLYPFEDVYFTDLRGSAGQPLKLTRAFAVPPGSYDIYVGIKERPAPGATEPTVKAAVLKQELTVPNYHGEELQTSSVIVADRIETLTAPVSPEAMKERPYVLGDAEIVPAADLKFKKTEELSIVFQVYGAKLGDDKKPDVTIEYAFMQKDAGGEKPFNKTSPQSFNAQTLPPNFDPTQGHQIVGGQAVPLATFPEGDFRLEIKITDNKAGKSITRDVLFSVVPAS